MPALAAFRRVSAETPEALRSAWLLRQMLRFEWDKHGKPQAVEGEHDDLVMAAAICHMARDQQSYEMPAAPGPAKRKLIDELNARNRHKRRT